MDLKVIPRSHKGHKYISCIIDEVTNYLVTVPIFQASSEEIGEAFIENVITNLNITNLGQMWPKHLSLAMFAYNTFNIPNLGNYSPYELTFGRKPSILIDVETII